MQKPPGLSATLVRFRATRLEACCSVADLTAGWVTLVRHKVQATHTQQAAHPQFQAGVSTHHPAAVYMPVHRLALALVCEDTPTSEESHVRRLHTLGRNVRQSKCTRKDCRTTWNNP